MNDACVNLTIVTTENGESISHEALTYLRNMIADLRGKLEEKSTALKAAEPAAADHYGTLLADLNRTVELTGVVVKATADMEKLQVSANKAMKRVWKKLCQ
jgi:hypothetical protein